MQGLPSAAPPALYAMLETPGGPRALASAARSLLLNNPILQHPGAPCHTLLTQLAGMGETAGMAYGGSGRGGGGASGGTSSSTGDGSSGIGRGSGGGSGGGGCDGAGGIGGASSILERPGGCRSTGGQQGACDSIGDGSSRTEKLPSISSVMSSTDAAEPISCGSACGNSQASYLAAQAGGAAVGTSGGSGCGGLAGSERKRVRDPCGGFLSQHQQQPQQGGGYRGSGSGAGSSSSGQSCAAVSQRSDSAAFHCPGGGADGWLSGPSSAGQPHGARTAALSGVPLRHDRSSEAIEVLSSQFFTGSAGPYSPPSAARHSAYSRGFARAASLGLVQNTPHPLLAPQSMPPPAPQPPHPPAPQSMLPPAPQSMHPPAPQSMHPPAPQPKPPPAAGEGATDER